MKIKVIKSPAEYESALARIDILMDSAKKNTPQGDELELLVLLVHDYEDRVYPIPKPDALTAIRFRMKQQGLEPKDLSPLFGKSKPGLRGAFRSAESQPQNDPIAG